MAAYAIFETEYKDATSGPKLMEGYSRWPETVAKFGGRPIIRAGEVHVLEGAWKHAFLVVIEFPSMESLRAWYDSKEYGALKPIRLAAMTADAFAVEGWNSAGLH